MTDLHTWDPAKLAAVPLLKWVGGKSALLPELRKRLPTRFGTYYEPFAGGAALFFALAAAVVRRDAYPWSHISDLNPHLIGAYRLVRDHPSEVLAALVDYERRHATVRPSKRYPAPALYYQVREIWNAGAFTTDHQHAAAFLYLNRTCFNGIWRVNKEGKFNVPAGRYKRPRIADERRLRVCAAALAGARVAVERWQDAIEGITKNDLVYFDPPYVPLSETANFTAYTQQGFGKDDHAELAEAAHALVRKGVHVIISNSDTPAVRKLYKGMRISRVKMARSLSCKGDRRQPVGELLIVGGRR
ncbi:MAG: Dam family site-specific DNA-(adenine-N6)-methyltransferase [Thermomicrobiales bacterium]|nr:Dam family site-specific DNA-(adenine-N6)-methyltransferase [Thermomicrobiales bacterium]